LFGAAGLGVVAGQETYDLTISDAVETPPKTVNYNQNSYEIDAFAVRESGEAIDVDVTVPDGDGFFVDMYNSDKGVEIFVDGDGSQTVTFAGTDTENLDPGTYSLVLSVDSNFRSVHPVVISGYDVSFTLPDEATSGGTVEIDDISIQKTELNDDPDKIEVVFWNEDRVERIEADSSNGSYSASVDLDGFDTGEYNVYVAALGEEEFQGEQEILGLSDRQTIDVIDGGGESDSEDGNNGGTIGGGGGGGGNQPPTDSPPLEGNETTNQNESDPDSGEQNETDVTPSEPTETVELVDEEPDSPGVQVSFENTTARAITLSNETATGSVTVTDRSSPPDDATPPPGSSIATVEITVPDAERNTSATIELAVPADAVNNSESLTVQRYNSDNNTWTELETTVEERNETTITVTAETPGFSIFTVTESNESTEPNESEANDPNGTNEQSDTNESSDPNDGTQPSDSTDGNDVITPSEPQSQPEDQPGFGIFSAAIAVFLTVVGYAVFSRSKAVHR
jgi:PGF-pre-PGF domain-containing protein